MGKFNYYAKGECPVCAGAGHKSNKVCRSTTLDDGRLKVHCWAGGDAPAGWGFIGDDTHGMSQYIEGWNNRQTVDWAERERKAAETRAQAERERLGRSTPRDRDATYRRWQDHQRLNQQDRDELSRRGLLPDEIQLAQDLGWLRRWERNAKRTGPANIPGVNVAGTDGLAIAAPDADGLIAGFQIKPDHQPKYRWLAGCVLRNDEQPVPVFKHPNYHGSVELWITEGFLKALITAFFAWRHGLTHIVVVGCGGSNWASCPKQLRVILEKHTPTAVHFLPDAGAFKNPNVKKQVRKLHKLLKVWDYPMLFRWWGQWSKEEALDPDEIGIETLLASPLLKRFPGSMGFGNRVAPAKVTRKNPEINTGKDLLQRWIESKKRFICDGSPTATGKNYSAGRARPEMFTLADGSKAQGLWFITDDARNPSTPTLQAAPWVTIEGRHGGLVLETDVDGSTIKRRMKPGDDKWDIQPNCSRNGVSGALRNKNIDGDSSQEVLCRACPKFGMCVGGGGPGYGYLYARYAAMKMSQRLINPNSLPSPDSMDLEQDVAMVDEFGEKCLIQTVTVEQSDVEQSIAILAGKHPELWDRVAPILQAIQELTESDDLGYHGLSHQPILDRIGAALANVDEQTMLQVETALQADLTALTEVAEGVKLSDLPASTLKKFTYSDKESVERIQKEPLQWLGNFYRIATGRSLGLLSTNRWGRITIQIPDQQLLNFLRACGRVIFLDATLPVEHLAAWLECDVDDIDFVAAPPSPSPVKIIQVKGLGKLTRNRSQSQLDRLERAINAIKRRHPELAKASAVIDFKESEHADAAWWRDTRGSNAFKDIRLTIAVGTPIANLNGMAAQFMAIYGQTPEFDSPEFQLFAQETLTATFTQTAGRKAGRRGQSGDVMYFLTEEDGVDEIAQSLGMAFSAVEAAALGDGIGDQGSQTRVAVARAMYRGHDREGTARAAGVSGGRVSQIVPTLGFGGGFKESAKRLAGFNSGLIKGTNVSTTLATYGIDAFKQDLRRWLSEIRTTFTPLPDPVLEHLRQELDAWGCGVAFGASPPPQELLELLREHGELAFKETLAAISKYGRAGLEAVVI